MRNLIKKLSVIIASVLAVSMTLSATCFAAEPDWLGLSPRLVEIAPGQSAVVHVAAEDNFRVYVDGNTSANTFAYVESPDKFQSYVTLYVGADEQSSDVVFYFYIVGTSIYSQINVRVVGTPVPAAPKADGTIPVSESDYIAFNQQVASAIASAAPGQNIKVSTATWTSFTSAVIGALCARPDVSLTVSFVWNGTPGSFTIPAGCASPALLNAEGFSGFLYLGGMFAR
jgi:hypothetical protein